MKSYLLIALFGAFGTVARFSVVQITPKIFQSTFPIGTLVVNLLGCFLIGLFIGVLIKRSAFAIGFIFVWFLLQLRFKHFKFYFLVFICNIIFIKIH